MATWSEFEQANKRRSSLITAAIVCGLAALMFMFGFSPPNPPLEPEGLLIDFGTSESGLGSFEPEAVQSGGTPDYQPQDQQVATQDEVKTVSLPDKKNTDKPKTETTTNNNNNTTNINKDELFDPSKLNTKGQTGSSEGNTYTGGNQGSQTGDPDGYHGPGAGKGDDGSIGWSLDGRNMKSKPSLQVEHNEVGDVRIKIYVDRNGKVTKAEYERSGSTITDTYLINQAKTAAMKATFNADPKSPETQVGYITFHFKVI